MHCHAQCSSTPQGWYKKRGHLPRITHSRSSTVQELAGASLTAPCGPTGNSQAKSAALTALPTHQRLPAFEGAAHGLLVGALPGAARIPGYNLFCDPLYYRDPLCHMEEMPKIHRNAQEILQAEGVLWGTPLDMKWGVLPSAKPTTAPTLCKPKYKQCNTKLSPSKPPGTCKQHLDFTT
eukprot:1148236-Pelagomonas_calceolata.AAC.5